MFRTSFLTSPTLILTFTLASCAQASSSEPRYQGTYTVPPTDSELSLPFVYPVEDIGWSESPEATSGRGPEPVALTYRLPAELVGPDFPEIHLVRKAVDGAAPFAVLSDAQGFAASCRRKPAMVICLISYKQIDASMDQVAAFLAGRYGDDPVKLAGLRGAAEGFHRQPIGVLSFSVPSSTP